MFIRCNDKKLLLTFILTLFTYQVNAQQSTAKSLFNAAEHMVFQIRVIDVNSDDKYSIGSGFAISDQGHIATNFHVISSYIHKPEKYRLEFVDANDQTGELSLLAIDVIHDLAIVKAEKTTRDYLRISEQSLSKGERIFSMGNPHDLGMTIVEGNYNGQIEKSRYKKILFSGSLNPGMSGGPALNGKGEVIGINVSKQGEQISFLVPATRLKTLKTQYAAQNEPLPFIEQITQDLLSDQQQFYSEILATKPGSKTLGHIEIPAELHPSLNCWGNSSDKKDMKYKVVTYSCRSNDEIYIKGNLMLGQLNYSTEYIDTEQLNRFQFYNLLENRFGHDYFNNSFDKEDYEPFKCHDDIVNINSNKWKISSCYRKYIKLKGIFDSSMVIASIDYPSKAAIINLSLFGVSFTNATDVYQQLIKEIEWMH